MDFEILSLIVCICALTVSAVYIYMQNIIIDVEYFDVLLKNSRKNSCDLKIAHISDVHIPNNVVSLDKIFDVLKFEKPDIIAVTGDLIYKYKDMDEEKLKKFCSTLSGIAKTYAVSGNHEIWSHSIQKWTEILKKSNISVLDNEIEIFEKEGQKYKIIGLKEGCLYSEELYNHEKNYDNIPKILLSHRPERFEKYYLSQDAIRPDLVLSGHAHGGQFRIPFIDKAVYAPDQGPFPKYSSGLYVSDNMVQMIVSRGLSNSFFPVRINNRIHMPVISIRKSSD